VNQEVEFFRASGREGKILLLLIDGEPGESFPPALGASADGSRGALEPLAADARARPGVSEKEAGRDAVTRIQAALLGVGFDALKQREAARRRVRRLLLACAGASTILLVCMAGWFALRAIDAQRLQSETTRVFDKLLLGGPAGETQVDKLRRATKGLEQESLDPRVESSVRDRLGEEFSRYGENALALPHFQRAYELRSKRGDALSMHESGLGLAQSLWESGCVEDAKRYSESACDYFEAHPRAAGALLWKARLYRASALKRSKDIAGASKEYLRIIDAEGSTAGPAFGLVSTAMYDLALCEQQEADALANQKDPTASVATVVAKFTHAVDLMTQARERCRAAGNDHRADFIIYGAEQARIHRRFSDYLGKSGDSAGSVQHSDRAITLYNEAIAEMEREIGAKSWRLAQTRANLGTAHLRAGRAADALPLYTQALESYRDPEMRGPWHAETLTVLKYHADACNKLNQPDVKNSEIVTHVDLLIHSTPKPGPCGGVVNGAEVEAFAVRLDELDMKDQAAAVWEWLRKLPNEVLIGGSDPTK
jgi:tetratricopeptide (TPR) repeat protein